MKRWFWLPAAALLAFAACDDKDGKAAAGHPSQHAAAAAPKPPAESGPRAPDALASQALAFADAGNAPSDEAATGAGDRFFDGAALRNAGFAVPAQDGAVYAGAGGSRRPRLGYTSPAPRALLDLSAAEPPLPGSSPARYQDASSAAARGAGKVLAAFDGFQRHMFDAAAPILSRAGWGASKRKGTPVAMTPTHVTVHHTDGRQTMTEADTAAEVRGIQQYHMYGRGREGKDVWDDIGYHFLIDGAGRVIEGRPAETLGAHAGGANENNIGIAMLGDYNKVKPTAEQVESLTRLVSFLAMKYQQDPSRQGFLEGHQHYNNTDCPGKNMMAILAALRARVDAETIKLAARVKAAPKGRFVPVLTDA